MSRQGRRGCCLEPHDELSLASYCGSLLSRNRPIEIYCDQLVYWEEGEITPRHFCIKDSLSFPSLDLDGFS